jgi:hypothetical protein
MGLCCKQRLEYSSNLLQKIVIKPKVYLVVVTSILPNLHSTTKLTKFWRDLITMNLSSRKIEIKKEVFDSYDSLMWMFK